MGKADKRDIENTLTSKADKNDVYTKGETDGKFQLKGDYFNKTEVVNLIIEVVKSKKKTDGNMKEQEIPFNLKYR